jgi:hypothetical protein
MSAMPKKTIRVNESAFEEAKAQKEKQGQTWDEYLTDSNRTGPDADDVATELTAKLNLDADDAKDEIESVRELVQETKAEVEAFESKLSVSLDATERHKIAQEVAEELR